MKKIKLGDVCKINTETYSDSNSYDFVNYLDTSNITANHIENIQHIDIAQEKLPSRARRKVKCNSIIYSTVRPNQRHYGIIKSQPENFLVSTGFAVIDVDPKKIDTNFLYYQLSRDEIVNNLQSIAEQSTTAYPSIKPSDLSNLEFYVPSLDTQRKIGNFLYALDDKIALNKKINATLEAMAKTLYDYWFVQFDFPDENGKPYKTNGGKMIYSSELGRNIPVGWKVQNLSEITTIIQGNSPDGSTLNDTGEGTIFFQGKTDFGFRFPEVRIYTTAPYRLAEKFDTLLSVRAPVGDANMAYEKCCIGRGLAAIHSDYPSFIYYTLKKLKPIFEKLGSIGTTFDSITKNDVMALKICIPPTKFVEKFENVVSKFDTEIFSNTNESRQLAALRDWLLPMLMNGQLNFKDV